MTEQGLQVIDKQVPAAPSAPLRSGPSDLRHAMMSLPVEQQDTMLAEFKERRDHFRDWLLKQLKPGIHYGFPPGCEPKFDDAGNVVHKGKIVPPEQWTNKPSLYAAGADFIVELMGLRDTYEADMELWEQLGKPNMTYVRKCELYSRATGELVGEGTGARRTSENDGSVNDSVKMAGKSAKIDAVFNAYGLRDLFTQPMDPPPRQPNPGKQAGAPKVEPRGQRIDSKAAGAIVDAIYRRWSACSHDPPGQDFPQFCEQATGEKFGFNKSTLWTKGDRLDKLQAAIERLEGGTPPPEPSHNQSDLPF